MHILFATPELAPYARLTELAMASRHIPAELKLAGVDVTIIAPLPAKDRAKDLSLAERLTQLRIPIDGSVYDVRVLESRTPESVRVFFLDNPKLFAAIHRQDRAAGLAAAAFSRAVCEFMAHFAFPVDVVHCNGWQSALVPVYLEERYADVDKLANVLVTYTIHDIAEQGLFDASVLQQIDLPNYLNHPQHLEFYDKLCYSKGGILYGDLITVVGRHHAQEVLTQEHGARLEGVLNERKDDLLGIAHGIELKKWNPATDKTLVENFETQSLNGKRKCKAALQKALGLEAVGTKPLLAFVGELDQDNGLDLVSDILDDLMDIDLQLIFVGKGNPSYEAAIKSWQEEFPKQIGCNFTEDEGELKAALAGADLLLFPALHYGSEQNHLYGMRFGALPVARAIGAYPDAIDEVNTEDQRGTGFLFAQYDADAFYESLAKALNLYTDQRLWRVIVVQAMRIDQSWKSTAKEYIKVYRDLVLELEG